MTPTCTAANILRLQNAGYEVTPSKTKPGKFRWWINVASDGVSVPSRECSDRTFIDESSAWASAFVDSAVRGVSGVTVVRQDFVDDVSGHVKKMAKTYGFSVDADTVRDCVEESAELLRLSMTEAEIVAACDEAIKAY